MNREEKSLLGKRKAKGKIFISHSSDDEHLVTKFCDLILDNGLGIDLKENVFCTSLAGSKPKSGDDFRNKIKAELLKAKVVFQFISEHYKKSEVCLNEMGAAWVLSKNVIPIIIDPGEYEIGFIHSTSQQLQLTKKSDLYKLIDDHGESIGLKKNYSSERLSKKIEEFIEWTEKNYIQEKKIINENGNYIYIIKNKHGKYLYESGQYRKLPDEETQYLLGYDKYPEKEIPEHELTQKIGINIESLRNSTIKQAKGHKEVWMIIKNKRHWVPDVITLEYILKQFPEINFRRGEATVVELEQIEQGRNLTSIRDKK